MEYEVLDNKFISIKGINHIKDSKVEVGEYTVENNTIEGNLVIDVTYIDNEEIENIFHSKIPIQIFIDDEDVQLEVKDTSLNVIDNQGIEVLFALIISSSEEKIKEEIKEQIDLKLEEALKERNDIASEHEEINEEEIEEIREKVIQEENVEKPIKIIDTSEEAIFPKFKDSCQTYKVVYNRFDEVHMDYELEKIIMDDNNIVIVKMDE